jgi:NAD(P)-dependent dehydrogenase (short-subunit alcohol dehydrogenase family)
MPDVEWSSSPVALISGASRGIGLAIARAFSGAGFRVALTARDASLLEANCRQLHTSGPAMSVAADLRHPAAAEHILAAVTAEFGPPQIIVNNAGSAPSDKFANTTDADLELALDLHVRAPFRLLRAALPGLRAQPDSCAIQVASTAGLVGYPFTSAYTAAKHGMVGLSRALAAEFGERAPRCFALCPGFVDTDITRRAAAAIASRGQKTAAQALAGLGAMNQIGRMHTTDEVAAAALYLAQQRPEGCVYNLDRDPPGFVA